MCIRDSSLGDAITRTRQYHGDDAGRDEHCAGPVGRRRSPPVETEAGPDRTDDAGERGHASVSYTHLRAHETVLDLVCRLLLEKKKTNN